MTAENGRCPAGKLNCWSQLVAYAVASEPLAREAMHDCDTLRAGSHQRRQPLWRRLAVDERERPNAILSTLSAARVQHLVHATRGSGCLRSALRGAGLCSLLPALGWNHHHQRLPGWLRAD